MSETEAARLTDALEGRYRIERELGEGGMATVYLADDLRHERKVALKVLRPELAAVVGAERFLAEIKTTANLQHPHILALFDSGEADGFLYYVMPYIEGETLADRLAREKQLPIEEAVRIAADVADALHAAHEQGVVHRDIKPANILLSRGRPLVADFGIALAIGSASGARLTETGLSVGTPFYMSPEQVTGDHEIGPRSDVYALACVVYEMLVGEPPHAARSAQAVISKIVAGEPVSPAGKRPTVPANVDAAVRRALERLPADRFTDATDFLTALQDPSFRHGGPTEAVGPAATGRRGLGIAVAASGWVAAAVAVLTLGQPREGPPSSFVVRSEVFRTPDQDWVGAGGIGITIAPDGDAIAYIGGEQIFYRRLDELESRPLTGTKLGRMPVISPDGSMIAFVHAGGFGGGLLTVSVQGGPPTVVVPEGVRDGGGGLAWGYDGSLYYSIRSGAVMRVSAAGGQPEEVMVAEAGSAYQWFDVLPGNRGLVLTINTGPAEDSRIAVLDFATGEVRPLVPGTTARYARSGYLVYASADSSLSAVHFDLETLELEPGAQPIRLVDRLDVNAGSASQFAISRSGTLVYATGTNVGHSRPVRIDRGGNKRPIDPDWTLRSSADNSSLSLSPAGDRIAFNTLSDGTVSVWIKPVDGGPAERVTFGPSSTTEFQATWAPDGRSLLFVADWEGQQDLWLTRTDGLVDPELLYDAAEPIHEGIYSPDGAWIVYQAGQALEADIYVVRVGADDAAVPILATEFRERNPVLSPDGHWLAYVSDASGRDEVYVVSFPDPTGSGRISVSEGGGAEPAWGHNGRELFYRSVDDFLVSAEYSAGDAFTIIDRTPLFSLEGVVEGLWRGLIVPSADDRTFYALELVQDSRPVRIILVQNLFESLTSD